MTADVIALHPSFDPVRVEITSPGTQGGRLYYFVDYVEADGDGSTIWGGHDLAEARRVAWEIGQEDGLPVKDLTGADSVETAAGPVR